MTPDLRARAREVISRFSEKGLMLATAESCTGGMIVATLTCIDGSSRVVDRGFVTYSNEAKQEMIGVPPSLIEAHGAVSEPVARAMAEGAVARSRADVAVSVTGVAGPGGGSPEKPVGLVHLAACGPVGNLHRRELFDGDRDAVREQTVAVALAMALEAADQP